MRRLLVPCFAFAAVLCQAQTSTDNFSTAANWTAPISRANGALAITGGRVNYTSSGLVEGSNSFISWTGGTFSYVTNWEVQVDVHARAASATAMFDYFYASLNAYRTGDPVGQVSAADKPLYTSVSADIIRPGGATNAFQLGYALAGNDWFELPSNGAGIANPTTDAALRITFDATTKVMTAYYDANGATGGYTWTSIASIDIDGPQNFGMTAASTFTIALSVASGRDRFVDGDVYFDNFSATRAAAAPVIATQPATQHSVAGGNVTLTAGVSGAGNNFQWNKDGVPLPGATNSSLAVTNVSPANVGNYTVVVSNSAGSTTSNPATLAIAAASTVGRLTNLSLLTTLGSGGDFFTMGYVVGGAGTSGAKPLVIRVAGPSLAQLGVTGALDDPKLELFAGAAKTSENDNWGGAADLTAAMAAVGAFAFTGPTSRDAASALNITSSDNSVKVSAASTGSGLVIAEIYDATDPSNFTVATPRLVNVSVLKHIGAGVTMGFVVGGSSSKTVLIRAIGPTLGAAPFNVGGVVADPQVSVFSGQTRVSENNDWGGTAVLTAAFAQVGAFALPPTSRDAVVLATLQPGNYTVQVSGVNNTTGIAIIEVYEMP